MHQLTPRRGTPLKTANICSTVQQIPYLLQDLKVCYHDHNCLSLRIALSYTSPINTLIPNLKCIFILSCQSQWLRGLRRRSTATHLLRLWVRIPLGAWMSVCCEWYVLSGRGLCDTLITHPEESYRLWCVDVCDLRGSYRKSWAMSHSWQLCNIKRSSIVW